MIIKVSVISVFLWFSTDCNKNTCYNTSGKAGGSRHRSRMCQRHSRNNRMMTVWRRCNLMGSRQVVQRAVMTQMLWRRIRQIAIDTVVGRWLRDVHRTESMFEVTATADLFWYWHQCCTHRQHFIQFISFYSRKFFELLIIFILTLFKRVVGYHTKA